MRFDPKPVAKQFWGLVGFKEGFPRVLEGVVSMALPVSIVVLPNPTPASIQAWLSGRGVTWRAMSGSRALRGCLLAHRGHGFVFLDETLAADERRFTVAHETAHFLHHYVNPRDDAIRRLGAEVRPVLDGDRQPTPAEKLAGVIRGIELGCQTHLLDRDPDGAPTSAVIRAETEADLIAFELLAPMHAILRNTKPGKPRVESLITDYGLPQWAAFAWGGWLDGLGRSDSFLTRLRTLTRTE